MAIRVQYFKRINAFMDESKEGTIRDYLRDQAPWLMDGTDLNIALGLLAWFVENGRMTVDEMCDVLQMNDVYRPHYFEDATP